MKFHDVIAANSIGYYNACQRYARRMQHQFPKLPLDCLGTYLFEALWTKDLDVDSMRHAQAVVYMTMSWRSLTYIQRSIRKKRAPRGEFLSLHHDTGEALGEEPYIAEPCLRQALESLPPIKRAIILRHNVRGEVLTRVGAEYGASEQLTSYHYRTGLAALRRFLMGGRCKWRNYSAATRT